MKKKEILFESRVDKWRNYRDEIEKESNKASNSKSDIKLIKQKKEINSIDPAILEGIDTNITISSGLNANINFSDNYSKLNFSMEGINQAFLNDLKQQMDEASQIKQKSFVIDQNFELIDLGLQRDKKAKQTFEELNNMIDNIADSIQHFPDVAKENLSILESSLKVAKSKKEPIHSSMKVNISSIENSKDLKKPFFISFGISLCSILVIIIMIVMVFIFWK